MILRSNFSTTVLEGEGLAANKSRVDSKIIKDDAIVKKKRATASEVTALDSYCKSQHQLSHRVSVERKLLEEIGAIYS